MTGSETPTLWRNADFLKLWAGQSVSLFGSQITLLALPLTAALTLKATSTQMGILVAAWNAPNVLSFMAGAWVDRTRRKPILIGADLGRAFLLLTVLLAAGLHLLHVELLYGIALLLGVLGVFFDVAYSSLLPDLITRDRLVEGNSKLQMSDAAARVVGPGLGGELVQLLTAPIAIGFDAVSFLVSAVSLLLIRTAETPPRSEEQRESIWREILVGATFVWHHPLMRPMLIFTAIWNFADSVIFAVYVLYATRILHLSPGALGLTLSVASLGFLIGAIVAPRAHKRVGLGPAIVAGGVIEGMGVILLPLAHGPPIFAAIILGTAQLVIGLGFPLAGIGTLSVRQSITPHHMLGRVSATWRSVTWGVLPVGNLLGGVLGSAVGLRGAIVAGAAAGFLAFFPLLLSPIKGLHEQPALAESM